MPRPIPRSVTHVTMTGSPLGESAKEELIALLTKRKLPRSGVCGFVSGINSAIVYAYALFPAMSTNGERHKWLSKAQQSIIKTRDALASAIDSQDADPTRWRGEDLRTLDLELFRCPGCPYINSTESLLLELFDRLAKACRSSAQQQTILRMRETVASADDNQDNELKSWRSEDLQALDSELINYRGHSYCQSAKSPILELLDRLAMVCETRTSSLKHSKRTVGKRQRLANELASTWRQRMKNKPTASVSVDVDGNSHTSPFVEALRFAVTIAEKRSPSDEVLRGLAERAIGWIKKRDEVASRYLIG